jgi:DNA polymerase-3 subunit alpha
VVLTVEASLEGDELKLLGRGVRPIDAAVAGTAGAGLRVFMTEATAADSLANRLADAATANHGRSIGPVHVVLMHPDLPGEVEIALPRTYPLSPQIIGAIKALPGVGHTETF